MTRRDTGYAMEPYTLTTASQVARKSKSTILRAIQKGRLSATRTDNGGWLIDASELHRAFSNALHVPHAQRSTEPSNALQPRNATAALQARLEATEARLTDARELDNRDAMRVLDPASTPRPRSGAADSDQPTPIGRPLRDGRGPSAAVAGGRGPLRGNSRSNLWPALSSGRRRYSVPSLSARCFSRPRDFKNVDYRLSAPLSSPLGGAFSSARRTRTDLPMVAVEPG